MTPVSHFDAALVSASPLALSEALLLAREGKRVVVFDRREVVGGAWRKEDTLGYADVEVGCHIFPEHPLVPVALRRLWGVTVAPLEPEPVQFTYWRGRLLRERYHGNGVSAALESLRALSTLARWLALQRKENSGLIEVFRSLRRSQAEAAAWLRKKVRPGPGFFYPPGGTGEMVRALLARALEAGVTLRLGIDVEALHVSSGRVSLRLRDAPDVSASEVVLTRGSQISAINGLPVPTKTTVRRHWVVVLDDPTPRTFSYMVFLAHPALERVSDVTGFARTLSDDRVGPGRKILCFYVSHQLYQSGREPAERVMLRMMKERGWIGQASTPIASEWWEDVECARDYRFVEYLSQAGTPIRVIKHYGIGLYLIDNFHRIP